jgi:hypothetical protein
MICIARGKKPRDFTRLAQHFFFFTKRKPVLKEKVSRGNLCNLVVSYKYKDFAEYVVKDRG